MRVRAFRWFGWLLVVAAATMLPAAIEQPADASHPAVYLIGQVLVASPSMGDPRFAGTVIYLVAHDQNGAMGLVLNRSLGEGSLKALLQGFGVDDAKTDGVVRLQYGGPVEPTRGFVLHSADYSGRNTRVIGDGVALSTGFDVLKALAVGGGPEQRRFYLGYAGWGPGQLEGELTRDDWMTAPADPAFIFDDDIDGVWKKATKSAGRTL
jgi:putative transcriptional regulator